MRGSCSENLLDLPACVHLEASSCPSYHLQWHQNRPWHSCCHSNVFSVTGKFTFSHSLFFCISSQLLRQQLRILMVLWFLLADFAALTVLGVCLVDLGLLTWCWEVESSFWQQSEQESNRVPLTWVETGQCFQTEFDLWLFPSHQISQHGQPPFMSPF